MLRKVFWLSLVVFFLAAFPPPNNNHNNNPKVGVDAISWDDVTDAFDDAVDAGSGLIEDGLDALSGLADSVAGAFTSLGSAITGVAAAAAVWLYSLSPTAGYSLVSIYSISSLAIDVIEDVVDGFNDTTWNKISDGAKYVVYNLDDIAEDVASDAVQFISDGANFLADLVDLGDLDDYLPFPFDVVDEQDFFTVAECVDDLVLESAIDFAESVVTTLIDLGSGSDEITLIFNTEDIKDELNVTYECLMSLGRDINSRESDSDDGNIISDYIQDAYDYFEYSELVHGIEFSFTACTLVCGSASIGFAVAPDSNRFAPYYVVKSGVETSSVVGASVEASWTFFPSWDAVAEGSGHVVSFDVSISLPLVPISVGTNIGVVIGDDGDFGGFQLTNDILDVTFGFNGAFGLGYSYISSYWIKTLKDVGDAWNAFEDVGDIAADNVNLAITGYNTLSETLGSGGYLNTDNTVSGSSDSTSITLECPSGELHSAGNASAITLGWIDIQQVIYGNSSGKNWCNSSTAYKQVYDECAWLSSCSFSVGTDNWGKPSDECENYDSTEYDFDVIYNCPSQGSVYDIGCFNADFWEIIDSGWVQDYSSYDFMDDNWEERENSIAKCSKIANDAGYSGFALYNRGMCLVGDDLMNDGVYNKYNATECTTTPQDGRGDPDSINVYIFADGSLAFEDLGCFNITFLDENYANMKIISMEKEHQLMQDNYKERSLSVSKCAQVADEKGYKGFAMLDGGKCFVGDDFEQLGSALEGNVTTFGCGTGSGNSIAYNMYTFPYATLDNDNDAEELTIGAIIGIVVGGIVFIAIIVVIVFLVRKKKIKFTIHRKNSRHIQHVPGEK